MAATSVGKSDSRGRTALHWAAYEGDKDLLETLLRDGADVEAVTVAGSTALHIAAKAGHAGLLGQLTTPTTLNCKNSQGFTPLHMALLYKQWEAAAMLVAAGASPYGSDRTPSLDCPCDDTPAPAMLLKAMLADPSPTGLVAQAMRWKGSDGRTMLHRAAAGSSAERVKRLLTVGADRDAVDASGSTPLHLAADQGRASLVPLLATPKNINQHRSDSLRTPLHMAADRGDLQVLKALVAAGAAVTSKDSSGRSGLSIAADRRDRLMVEALLAAGATANTQDSKGCSPLQAAVSRGDDDMVQVLLAAGAAADTQDTRGSSALSVAAKAGNIHMFQLLLQSLVKVYGVTQLQEPNPRPREYDEAQRKQDNGRWSLKAAAVAAVVPLAGRDIPCCSQLLAVVLDVLGPQLAHDLCHNVQYKLPREGGGYNYRMDCPDNLLADALLLCWLGAERRRLAPARLQRLVPALGGKQQHQQQQGHAAGHQQELKQLVTAAVVAAVQGNQEQAHALLAECVELHLQQPGNGMATASRPCGPSRGDLMQRPWGYTPELVQMVRSGLYEAKFARTADDLPVIADRSTRDNGIHYSQSLQRALLVAWVSAAQQPRPGLVASVVAAVTAAQQRQKAMATPQQQQQQQQQQQTVTVGGRGRSDAAGPAAPAAAARGAPAGPMAAAAAAVAGSASMAAATLAGSLAAKWPANASTRSAGSSKELPSAASRPAPTPDDAGRQPSAGGGP